MNNLNRITKRQRMTGIAALVEYSGLYCSPFCLLCITFFCRKTLRGFLRLQISKKLIAKANELRFSCSSFLSLFFAPEGVHLHPDPLMEISVKIS